MIICWITRNIDVYIFFRGKWYPYIAQTNISANMYLSFMKRNVNCMLFICFEWWRKKKSHTYIHTQHPSMWRRADKNRDRDESLSSSKRQHTHNFNREEIPYAFIFYVLCVCECGKIQSSAKTLDPEKLVVQWKFAL